MNKEKTLELIASLSNANGVSGFEEEVVSLVQEYAKEKELGQTSRDSLLNCYIQRAENTGNRPMVQLDAHSDEVGFMVQSITPAGTLTFIPMGGWIAHYVPAHRVRVRTKDGSYIPGITAAKPIHFMNKAEQGAPVSLENMVIDIGACSRQEAIEQFGVRVGEPIVPDVNFENLPDHELMLGKAFDCRLGCTAILKTLEALQGEQLCVDIISAMSTQEEIGTRGATVTANTIKPDIAIVFEGCPADDTFMADYAVQTALKKGPMLRYIDVRMVTNPRFQRYALDLAERLGIPVQAAVRSGGSTNGAPIHLSNQGVPVIVIGIPVRYIHSHYGFASYEDVENTVKLAVHLLKGLNEQIIKEF